MSSGLSKKNDKDDKIGSYLFVEPNIRFNISNYVISFSQLKSNTNGNKRMKSLKKLSKYSEEFRDILKKELK